MTLDHAENVAEQRQHVHAYVDRLPGDQLSALHGLLETMLSPLDRTLALAPLDDEPVTPEESQLLRRVPQRSMQDTAHRWNRYSPTSASPWTISKKWAKRKSPATFLKRLNHSS